ncbi:unnamed protein product [Larinioides sclopetarius]|uniref:Uncharacterized protein n=1 Tax=Larinioides sclopetarius TaxID=280406 RepID=A0AAV2AH08_9ARAC
MEVAKDYTDIIGGHGRFQLTILIFCFFCSAPYCMHDFSITFFAPNLDYWCARPEEVLQANISVDEWRNSSIPIIKSRSGIDEFSHCTVFNSSIENDLLYHQNYTDPVKCNSWEYDHSSHKRTIVDENPLEFSYHLLLLSSIVSEIVSFEYRTIYCFTYGRGFTLTLMLMPLIAWLIPNWFWLHLIFTLPWISLLCVFWVLPETPRWLLTNGKFSELEELLLYAAKKNRKDMQKAKGEISDYIAHHSHK